MDLNEQNLFLHLQQELTNSLNKIFETTNSNNKELNDKIEKMNNSINLVEKDLREKIGKWIGKSELMHQALYQVQRELREIREKTQKDENTAIKIKEKINFWDWFFKLLIGGLGGLVTYLITTIFLKK